MTNYTDHIRDVVESDIAVISEKEKTYKGSWKKRGGIGAFMMAARKWDRLETICSSILSRWHRSQASGGGVYDVFGHIAQSPLGADGSALAEIRDLRRYLTLIEAEMIARGVVSPEKVKSSLDSEYHEHITETLVPSPGKIGRLVPRGVPGTPEDGGQHSRQSEDD